MTSYTQKIISNIGGGRLYGIAASPDGKKVYVTNSFTSIVTVINAETDLSSATIPVGVSPRSVIFNKGGTKAYVANVGGNITVIDASNDSVLSTITSAGENYNIALSPDEKYLYATIKTPYNNNTLRVFDVSTGQQVGNEVFVGELPLYVAISPNGNKAYVTNCNSLTISAIDTSNPLSIQNISEINIGGSPMGIQFSPDGTKAYVAVTGLSQVVIINVATNAVVGNISIPGGAEACGLSISVDGTRLWVSTRNGFTIRVIDTGTNTVIDTINANIRVGNMVLNRKNNQNTLWVTNEEANSLTKIQYPIEIIPCFKSDTKILTSDGYRPIQHLRKGDLIKTLLDGYVPIKLIGSKKISHVASKERIKNQLYKLSRKQYPEVFEDLIITGCHSILVDKFKNDEQREKVSQMDDGIFITDNKYRLPAVFDENASVYEVPGMYTIYHFALEHEDYYMNYGVYANGLLVETCSERNMIELSGMKFMD